MPGLFYLDQVHQVRFLTTLGHWNYAGQRADKQTGDSCIHTSHAGSMEEMFPQVATAQGIAMPLCARPDSEARFTTDS
jgi:hypothetical protein